MSKLLECLYCKATSIGNLKKCGRCQIARYCSTECQKKDWTKHKQYCEELVKVKPQQDFLRSFVNQPEKYLIFDPAKITVLLIKNTGVFKQMVESKNIVPDSEIFLSFYYDDLNEFNQDFKVIIDKISLAKCIEVSDGIIENLKRGNKRILITYADDIEFLHYGDIPI